MKLSSKFIGNVVRIVLGIAFVVIGYQLGGKFLPQQILGVSQDLIKTILALVSGAVAIFVLPFVASWFVSLVTRWVVHIVQTTVAKTLAEFWSQRPRVKLGKGSKDSEVRDQDKSKLLGREDLNNAILVDTSVLIDGRILDIVNTGFLGEKFVVPQVVLEELQNIADSDDKLRRERGRRGLEILEELKDDKDVDLKITDFDGGAKEVDAALVKMAKKLNCKIATVDYNLNKVASLSGVRILNINELANALKTVVLPGEMLTLKIIQPGKEENQGVGYLPDGTMIVVENGSDKVGQTIQVEVSRILQTVAGRMVFARVQEGDKS